MNQPLHFILLTYFKGLLKNLFTKENMEINPNFKIMNETIEQSAKVM